MSSRGALLLAATVVLCGGCGGAPEPSTAREAVKQWTEAVNRQDWSRACELSAGRDGSCESKLRSTFGGDRLSFEGSASEGRRPKPGESFFALRGKRTTVFLTALAKGDGYTVRVDAVVES